TLILNQETPMRMTDKVHIRLAMAVAVVLIGTIVTLAYHLASSPQRVQLAVPAADAHKVSFFALGDQGSGQFRQWTVARSMDQVAERTRDLDFVVLLGDSFYGNGVESARDKQWNWKFENV
ncbi:MAG TPA: hypothetical protein PL117_12820, partial [Accumulibacter sp.]|nr:hypothetical protein [Accumulibacter sp.]HRF73648.1 hypothetical protein [Accumulibacter sp.]